jgi:hypothetical protein
MKNAETALAPWVMRHVRSAFLYEGSRLLRREVRPGTAILAHDKTNVGLEITVETLLPFLPVRRAQGLLSTSSKGRALFAHGLASSAARRARRRCSCSFTGGWGCEPHVSHSREPPVR